jgi:hypothetical protein
MTVLLGLVEGGFQVAGWLCVAAIVFFSGVLTRAVVRSRRSRWVATPEQIARFERYMPPLSDAA